MCRQEFRNKEGDKMWNVSVLVAVAAVTNLAA